MMAIREIIYLPDPRLRKKSIPVERFDSHLQTLIDDMFETMYAARGVGLAAPQIGINLRLSVVDVVGDKKQQFVLVNPEIEFLSEHVTFTEGCLSVPGVYDEVKRAQRVRLKALDRNAKPYTVEAEGLLAECFQHEVDHLNGKLFIDLLSMLKRTLARKKLEKFKREHPLKPNTRTS